jgi:hypothetical protein
MDELDIIFKYGSNLTVAGVLLWVVRSLYGFVHGLLDKYDKLAQKVIDVYSDQTEKSEKVISDMERRAQELIDKTRQTLSYERNFFLEFMEKKNDEIKEKDEFIFKLLNDYATTKFVQKT